MCCQLSVSMCPGPEAGCCTWFTATLVEVSPDGNETMSISWNGGPLFPPPPPPRSSSVVSQSLGTVAVKGADWLRNPIKLEAWLKTLGIGGWQDGWDRFSSWNLADSAAGKEGVLGVLVSLHSLHSPLCRRGLNIVTQSRSASLPLLSSYLSRKPIEHIYDKIKNYFLESIKHKMHILFQERPWWLTSIRETTEEPHHFQLIVNCLIKAVNINEQYNNKC